MDSLKSVKPGLLILVLVLILTGCATPVAASPGETATAILPTTTAIAALAPLAATIEATPTPAMPAATATATPASTALAASPVTAKTIPAGLTAPTATGQSILLVNVPLYQQPSGASCGPVSFTMAWDYANPKAPLEMQNVIQTAVEQKWYLPYDPLRIYTSPENLYKLAQYYANSKGQNPPEMGNVNVNDPTGAQAFLREQLSFGRPVIVDVMTVFKNGAFSTAHFVVVTGIDANNTVHVNDPYGYAAPYARHAMQRSVPWDTFWWLWRMNADPGGQGWWLVVNTSSQSSQG